MRLYSRSYGPALLAGLLLFSLTGLLRLHAQGADAPVSRDLPLPVSVSTCQGPAACLGVSNLVYTPGGRVRAAFVEPAAAGAVVRIYELDTFLSAWSRVKAWADLPVPGWVSLQGHLQVVLSSARDGSLALGLCSRSAGSRSVQFILGSPLRDQGASSDELGLQGLSVPVYSSDKLLVLRAQRSGSVVGLLYLASGASPRRNSLPFLPSGLVQPLVFPDGRILIALRGDSLSSKADVQVLSLSEEGVGEGLGPVWREQTESAQPQDMDLSLAGSVTAPLAALAWYTADGEEPRILVSQTPDAGQRWTPAARVDLGRPKGKPAVLIRPDASMFVIWEEREGEDASQPEALCLRRFGSNGSSLPPAALRILQPHSPADQLELALAHPGLDQTGDLLVALRLSQGTQETLLVRVPSEAALREADAGCKCGPGPEPGLHLRCRIHSIDTAGGRLVVMHEGVRGLLRPGLLTAVAPAGLPEGLTVGGQVFLRLEGTATDGVWRMVGLESLEAPAPALR